MVRYTDVAADLHRRLREGEYPAGLPLPSERALAEEYGVSRGALRNALGALQRRGLIAPHRSSGWVVESGAHTQGTEELRSFAQWARSSGLTPGGTFVELERRHPTAREAAFSGTATTEKILSYVRLRTLNGQTVMIERSVCAPVVGAVIENLSSDVSSTVEALSAAGVEIAAGEHQIDAVAATSEDARLLGGRRSSPLLRVRRTFFAPDGRGLVSGEDRYLPGTVSFVVNAVASRNVIARVVE